MTGQLEHFGVGLGVKDEGRADGHELQDGEERARHRKGGDGKFFSLERGSGRDGTVITLFIYSSLRTAQHRSTINLSGPGIMMGQC